VNLILLKSGELDVRGRAILTDGRARHILRILKAKPGKKLRIGLLNGPLGTGTVEHAGKDSIMLRCVFESDPPPKPVIDLLLAMPRPKVMKRLWAQLAALGTGRIVVVNAEKVEKYYFDSHVLHPDFFNERLIEGLQQACCTHLPEVLVRRRFKPFVEDELDSLFPDSLRLAADPKGREKTDGFFRGPKISGRALLAVGPEGGWTPYELEKLKLHGFEVVSMGPRILRTDTACICLHAIIGKYLQIRISHEENRNGQ